MLVRARGRGRCALSKGARGARAGEEGPELVRAEGDAPLSGPERAELVRAEGDAPLSGPERSELVRGPADACAHECSKRVFENLSAWLYEGEIGLRGALEAGVGDHGNTDHGPVYCQRTI
jgi:hypothetical protein